MSAANRRAGVRRDGDRYFTPPELARVLVGVLGVRPGQSAIEPSIGRGAFATVLIDRGVRVTGVDNDPDAPGLALPGLTAVCADVLTYRRAVGFDWAIGNPPYSRAEAHVRHCLTLAPRVAMLLRLGFLESKARKPFWGEHPVRRVWVLTERPSFTGSGTDATAYGLFLWDQRRRWAWRRRLWPVATLRHLSWRVT